ncbi:serine hydrolase [Trichinella nativa]|uniref:Serine hydrolase n=1 Tax=Trichinella nativa TaxID=6335 RepID=A0A1Y3ETX5_9BILA|nr:serine hydrolase [Trichinella nativa]
MRKPLTKVVEFYYVDAPHFSNHSDNDAEIEARSWWFSQENNRFSSKDITDLCTGFQESHNFDGILGFSQGACMASLICSLSIQGTILKIVSEFQHRIRFAILISGFVSKSSGHIALQQQELNIPSLHIVGQADEIVPKEMSLALANRFVSPHVVEHDGGHYVPSKGPTREALKSFIQQFIV